MMLVFLPLLMVLNWKIKLEGYLPISLHHYSTLNLERNQKQALILKSQFCKTGLTNGKTSVVMKKVNWMVNLCH